MNAVADNAYVHVAVGAVVNEQGQVLITQRPDHVHQGGLWEFPGGKLEPGETVEMALKRELREELDINITAFRPLIRIYYRYADKPVLLDVWRVEGYRGVPRGVESQPLRWVAPSALVPADFPVADTPIINALRLPSTYLITGEPENEPDVFLRRLNQALARGSRLIQLRAKQLSKGSLLNLYRQAQGMTMSYGATLLLNGSPAQAQAVEAEGVHLTSARLMGLDSRPLPSDQWVAASCHTAEELTHACRIGVDFVVVSPLRATRSHPDAVPMGWRGLRGLTEAATCPVYALGGMAQADLGQAWRHGAQGIAAVRALWEQGDE